MLTNHNYSFYVYVYGNTPEKFAVINFCLWKVIAHLFKISKTSAYSLNNSQNEFFWSFVFPQVGFQQKIRVKIAYRWRIRALNL